jgi:2-C-methyl-D-erythritol 4-phosphate cytidylyltransferase/2-C-methyl-D-erythritol 2,4-cyclodiphosphate synthase
LRQSKSCDKIDVTVPDPIHVAAIIAAGGRGTRLGSAAPKQFLPIGDRTMLDMSVRAFVEHARVSEIVVAAPAEYVDDVARSIEALRSALSVSSAALDESKSVSVVAGGARRQDSVANAFAQVSPRADVVLIHDAARPFVTAELIGRMIDAGDRHGAAIAAIAAKDTVKQVGSAGPGGERPITATLPREEIYLAQTPQAFRRDVLSKALGAANASADATDEAALAERAGITVHVVEGDAGNIKITTPNDLATAKAVALQDLAGPRIGIGYDLHRLTAGRPLILAGVRIPFELGLDGHSDADIVCHAVTDAILGAAAAGDIGRLFPDTDPKWKDADSIDLLKGALAHVTAKGFRVSNVDVTVIAQKPKLLPYLDEMRANLAAALQADPSAISIKGKTNEGVDSMGRGESMACQAVALLTS